MLQADLSIDDGDGATVLGPVWQMPRVGRQDCVKQPCT